MQPPDCNKKCSRLTGKFFLAKNNFDMSRENIWSKTAFKVLQLIAVNDIPKLFRVI